VRRWTARARAETMFAVGEAERPAQVEAEAADEAHAHESKLQRDWTPRRGDDAGEEGGSPCGSSRPAEVAAGRAQSGARR